MDENDRLHNKLLRLQAEYEKLKQRFNIRDSLSGNDVTDVSDGDEDKPLSHAEESAIEECLNDTEGSLSNVDLNIFDDVSDGLHVHKTRKSRGQRTSERANMELGESGTDCDSSSLDDIGNNISDNTKSMVADSAVFNQTLARAAHLSLQESTERTHGERHGSFFNRNNNRRVVRRKRKDSPPIRKMDKAHIYSFFSAMADLVSTFPNKHVETAKQNVRIILQEMVDKLNKWYHNNDPKNPLHGSTFNPSDLHLIHYKISRLQYIH